MKKITALFLTFVLIIGLVPYTAQADASVSTYAALQAAVAAAPADGVTVTTITLLNDISATGGAISIAAGQNIVLTSAAGSIFTFTQATSGQRHFNVAGSLTLQNITLSGPGGGTTAIVGGVNVTGTLTVGVGATITNNRAPGSNAASYGGGVNVVGGALVVSGGTISNNASSWEGGGVYVTGNGTFTMTSGTISGNTAVNNGGGVSVQNGYITISGGTISGNTVTSASGLGGGIYLASANLTMSGGTISGNRAYNGGGIYTAASGAINMTGGTLSNNVAAANGGAIFTAQYTTNNPLPPNSYINLIIGAAVVFANNVAGSGARIPPANLNSTQIATNSNSSIFGNPLNNLDINYFGQAGVMVTYLTVTFSPGTNGTFPAGTQTQQSVPTTNSPLIPSPPIPVPVPSLNYGFIGWTPDGGVTVLSSAQVLTTPLINNTTYVALYAPPITVTFDAQGGTPAIQTVTPVRVTGTYANALSQVSTPARSGYIFTGWFTAPSADPTGVQILSTSIVTSTTNQTLYARWITDPTVTITFNANGGTPAIQVVPSRVVGSTYAATLAAVTTPALIDNAFVGWFTAPTGGTQITASSIIPAANTTVYAQWISIRPITITFDAQGGVPAFQYEQVQIGGLYGDAMSLITTPTRLSYAFTGWFTAQTGGTQILPTTVVTATSDQVLFAQWTLVTATITFDGNGGTPASQLVTGQRVGSTYAAAVNAVTAPTRSGYTFNGWYDAVTGGNLITAFSTIPAANTTVYAQWTPNPPISVIFNAQGGLFNPAHVIPGSGVTLDPTQQIATYAPFTFPGLGLIGGVTVGGVFTPAFSATANPIFAGYSFGGWWTTPNGDTSGVQVLPTSTVWNPAPGTSITLYAHWIQNPVVTITFDGNGGTPTPQVVTGNLPGTYYSTALSSVATPTRTGYTFNGWFHSPTDLYQITVSSVIPAVNTTVYAQWTPIPTTTVLFDANGGSFNPTYVIPGAGTTLNYDPITSMYTTAIYTPLMIGGTFTPSMSATPNPDPPPPSAGVTYNFNGWWTTLNAPGDTTTGTQIQPTDIVTNPSPATEIILYANWSTTPTVTLTFFGNGGTPIVQQLEGEIPGNNLEQAIINGYVQTPTQAGYTFDGWADATGNLITSYTSIPSTSSQFHAQWTPIPPITVTFDAQGGLINGIYSTLQESVTPELTYANALAAVGYPTRAGYAFTGWFTQPTSGGTEILPTTVVQPTDTIFYAQWVQVTMDITFYGNGGTPVQQAVTDQAIGGTYAAALNAVTTPTQAGYTFNGWYDAPAGGNPVTATSTVTTAINAVYAQWTPIPPVTVVFNAQGGTFNPANIIPGAGVTLYWDPIAQMYTTATYAPFTVPGLGLIGGVTVGETFAPAFSATANPSRAGYFFGGWWTTPDATPGTQVIASDIVWDPGASEEITLYVHWIPDPTVTITFVGNGGTPVTQVVPGNIPGTSFAPVLAAVTTPAQANNAFAGWFGSPQILPTSYIPSVDATVTAEWISTPTITVTFDAQGGWPTGQQATLQTGNLYGSILSGITNPTQYGYIFEGWFTTPNGDDTGVQILDDTVVTAITNQTLYAHWIPVVVTITFDAQGGTPATQVVTGKVPGARYSVTFASITQPIKPGYTFTGWYTAPIFSDGLMVFPTDFVPEVSTTLYAGWIPTALTISFDALGAAPVMQQEPGTTGSTFASPLAAVTNPTMAGSTFAGWFTQIIGGTQVTPATVITETEDFTVYAQWIPSQQPLQAITVTFDAQGGTPAIQTAQATVGSTYAGAFAALTTPTRAGYVFQGWFTAQTGGTQVLSTNTVTQTTNQTLYAQWTPAAQPSTPPQPPTPTPDPTLPHIPWQPRPPLSPGEGHGLGPGPGNGYINGETGTEDTGYAPIVDKPSPVVPSPPVFIPLNPMPVAPIHYAFMIGYAEDNTIRPHANITRAEVTTIFFRLITDEHRASIWSQTSAFADVSAGARWFNNSISTMERGGLFAGIPLGDHFSPNQAATRAEFAAMVVNYLGLGHVTNVETDAFTDITGHWATDAIHVAYLQGWVRGFGDGTFRPDQLITRAEVAALVNRALGRLPQYPSDLLEGMITWPDNMNQSAWYYLYIQEATNSHYHVQKADGIHETWTQLIEPRNWRALERPYSMPWDILAD